MSWGDEQPRSHISSGWEGMTWLECTDDLGESLQMIWPNRDMAGWWHLMIFYRKDWGEMWQDTPGVPWDPGTFDHLPEGIKVV